MRASVHRRVRPLIDAQQGVVTSAQLRGLGVDLALPRREGWLRLANGLWVTSDEPTDEQLFGALALYAPRAVASGALACRWLELRHPPDDALCRALAAHGTTLLGGPLLRVHQTRRMPTALEHRAQRVAPPVRSVADAARWATSLRDARAVVLAALADGHVDPVGLHQEADAGTRRRVAWLRTALTDWERGARSAPEAEAADLLLAARPRYPVLLNPVLRLDGTLLGSPDGYLPAAGLGWEIDSVEHHGGASDLDATLRRHQRFADAGVELLHVTPTRLRAERRAWAIDVLRRAEQRMAAGWSCPGLAVEPVGPVLLDRAA